MRKYKYAKSSLGRNSFYN